MRLCLRNLLVTMTMFLCWTASTEAQTPDLTPRAGETLGQFKARTNGGPATESTARPAAQAAAERQAVDESTARIMAQPATPSSGGFGSRVADSLSDFLPLFDFAVDAIDTADDQKSVTVSFSPVRLGAYGEIDINAKLFEPEPFASLLEKVPEAAREAQKTAIAKAVDDFSDVLWSATYGLQWKVDSTWAEAPKLLFGRNPALYETLISELMGELWPDVWASIPEDTSRFLGSCEEEIGRRFDTGSGFVNVDALAASAVQARLADDPICPWDRYTEALSGRRKQIAAANQLLDKAKIDQIATMIDNQPQLTLQYSMRERDPLAGQDETSWTMKFELGTRNLNTALREYRKLVNRRTAGIQGAPEPSVAAALKEVASRPYEKKDKFTFAVVWRQRGAYSERYDFIEKVTDPATGSEVEFPRSVSLDLDERDEWCGMAQWSRSVPSQAFMRDGVRVVPRFEGAIEYVDVQGDPKRQNRYVARLSYLLPGPKGMTLPFTVTWADRSEFLGEQDHIFGAHLGISYKLGKPSSN